MDCLSLMSLEITTSGCKGFFNHRIFLYSSVFIRKILKKAQGIPLQDARRSVLRVIKWSFAANNRHQIRLLLRGDVFLFLACFLHWSTFMVNDTFVARCRIISPSKITFSMGQRLKTFLYRNLYLSFFGL